MLTKNDVANLALGRLGVSLSVADIDTENSVQAKVIRRHLRMSLDTILERHPWTFANHTQALTLHEEDPSEAFKFAYDLPSDCLVLRRIAQEGIFHQTKEYEDMKDPWKQVYTGTSTQRIWCNVYLAHGEYTVRISEDSAVPVHFGRAWAAQLSMDIAPSLITNNFAKVKQLLNSEARNEIFDQIANDLGRQTQAVDPASPFQRVRGW